VITESLRRIYQRGVPSAVRQRIRKTAREIPIRVRDFPSDLRERFSPGVVPLPPARLRGRVGIDSSRAHFIDVGRRAADDIVAALRAVDSPDAYPRWLDFGCGAGRVARHLIRHDFIRRITGIDVDTSAIRWSSRHLRDEYRVINAIPPTALADGAFDIVCAVSVFTHFDEETQFAWLSELRRLLRPGGLLIASTQGPHLTPNRPDLSMRDHEQLRDRGFVFRAGIGPFNEDTAFHSRGYLEHEWSTAFELIAFKPSGLVDYLDLSVWRRGATPA
jgi:SAM-dependent methyltransferase